MLLALDPRSRSLLGALAFVFAVEPRAGPGSLPVGGVAPCDLRPADSPRAAAPARRRSLARPSTRSARSSCWRSSACSSSSARSTLPATSRCAPSGRTASSARALLVFLAHVRSSSSPSTSASCGSRSRRPPSLGAAALLQQQPALARGDLEVPAHRLRGHRPGAARLVLPRLLGLQRRHGHVAALRRPRARGAAPVAARGCAPPSSCCSSATAPRWGWRRCTPGSPTPTAKRPAWSARCWPAALTSCAFLALLRFYQICDAAGDGGLRRGTCWWSSGFSRWRVAARVHGRASATTSACSPTRASSTWASWSSASGSAGSARVRRAPPRRSTTASPRACSSWPPGNIHRAYGSKTHRRRQRRPPPAAPVSARSSWPASSPSPARRHSARSSASSPS